MDWHKEKIKTSLLSRRKMGPNCTICTCLLFLGFYINNKCPLKARLSVTFEEGNTLSDGWTGPGTFPAVLCTTRRSMSQLRQWL